MNRFKILSNGFLSGFTYCFIAITLQAVLTELGYSISFLSSIALVILPYSFKFLWSGFADKIEKTSIEKLISFFILIISVNFFFLFLFNNFYNPFFYLMLLNLAFLGSCFDILTDANLIKNYSDEIRPKLLTFYIFGWRLAFIFAGGALLYLFNKLLQSDMEYLFILSGIMFFIFFLGFMKFKISNILSLVKINYQYFFILFPIFSLYFILKTSFTNLKDSFSILYELKNLYLFSILYKLFDLTFTSLITIFIIQKFGIKLDAFGTINSITSLIAILSCGYIWSKLNEKYSNIIILIASSLFKTLTLFLCIYIYHFKYYNFHSLIILFLLNIFSTSLITYSFSNFIMTTVKGARSSFKYSILTSLPMLFLLCTVPLSSFLINHYNWAIFFIFIILLQFLSFLSLFSIRSKNKF